MRNFTHIHVHTEYSILDGYNRIKNLIAKAKELNMKYITITDHNHLGGVPAFVEECNKEGINAIIGCELYYTWDTNIISLPKEERDKIAFEKAKEAGALNNVKKLPKKIGKKIPKNLKPLIQPYQYDTSNYHILLIALNQNGFKNLVKLQSEASKLGSYDGRYHCDDRLLELYNEDLICTTACIGSAPAKLINNGRIKEALNLILKWKDIFKDRFFLEIQPLNIKEQRLVNYYYSIWSKKYNIPMVATNDSHYTNKEDWDDHDVLLCIGTKSLKSEIKRMKFSNDFWIKSYDEMIEAFEIQANNIQKEYKNLSAKEYKNIYVKALENTNKIAEKTSPIKVGSDEPLYPKIATPNNVPSKDYLRMLCYKGLFKYKKLHPMINLETYKKRLNQELKVINKKNYSDYFLIVKDYVDYANNNGCLTGPSRGSAGGSLALFLLGISKIIDPIKYGLLFFRFLTMDRTSPPDVDVDFDYFNRWKVLKYLEDKYGKDKVAHIGTWGELGVKNGIKDVGRVLGYDFSVTDSITKKIDEISGEDPNVSFKSLDKMKDSSIERERKAWNDFNTLEENYNEIFRLARKFEGIPRQIGCHASGILITPMPINDFVPTRVDKDGQIVTLYSGVQLENLGFLKFDVLGLKTLSLINMTVNCVNKPKKLNIQKLYNGIENYSEDEKIFNMIKAKKTEGLFQIESNLFKGMIDIIKPENIIDLLVMVSLGRPGPLKCGMDKAYARRKHGEEEALEPLPNTWDITKDELGTIPYQESLMLIAQKVAGFNDNQSDSYLRKAISKKKEVLMNMCRQWFIYGKKNCSPPKNYDETNKNQIMYDEECKYGDEIIGGIANGYDEKQLSDFWEMIKGFADYLFNKSHGAAYAILLLITAYLKSYYPKEFMTALLSVYQNDPDDKEKYMNICRKMKIDLKPPDINKSGEFFTYHDGSILCSLKCVSGIGDPKIKSIVTNQPYSDLKDCMDKNGGKIFNKTAGMNLIKAGAFDNIEYNRYKLINNFLDIRRKKEDGLDRFNIDEFNENIASKFEIETIGTSISVTPWWETIKTNEKVKIEIPLEKVYEKTQKDGKLMAFVNTTYKDCKISCLIFGSQYSKFSEYFDTKIYKTILVEGIKNDRDCLIINKVIKKKDTIVKNNKNSTFTHSFMKKINKRVSELY